MNALEKMAMEQLMGCLYKSLDRFQEIRNMGESADLNTYVHRAQFIKTDVKDALKIAKALLENSNSPT